jgi:glutathionylspermidine synthase
VALLSAPGFLEDQQVTTFLASQLQERGVRTLLLHHPSQLNWKYGSATAMFKGEHIPLNAVVRFYQAEWLARLPASCGWKWLFFGGKTKVSNPAAALLSESKRFALTWDSLSSKMTTWKALLPECRDPREGSWRNEDDWVLKAAFSNTGDEVYIRETIDCSAWVKLSHCVASHPEHWVAQRRFAPVAISSDVGPLYPCIGVYTINGRAAGIYARASLKQIVDYAAMDVAVLITEKTNA